MHGQPEPSRSIDVLIVDDSADLAMMVSRLLSAEKDIRVVGVLPEAGSLAAKIRELRPRVVLLDLSMPGVPPLTALREASEACREAFTQVIAFSGHDDPDTEAEAIEAGAWGLISKGDDPARIVSIVRKAAAS